MFSRLVSLAVVAIAVCNAGLTGHHGGQSYANTNNWQSHGGHEAAWEGHGNQLASHGNAWGGHGNSWASHNNQWAENNWAGHGNAWAAHGNHGSHSNQGSESNWAGHGNAWTAHGNHGSHSNQGSDSNWAGHGNDYHGSENAHAWAGDNHGYHGHHEVQVDYHAHPKYEFNYGVSDAHTHDNKQQKEWRDGDVVKGEYSLHESDGTIRTVKYTSDHKNGFNAQVIRTGHAQHPETHVKPAFVVPVHGGHGGYGNNHY